MSQSEELAIERHRLERIIKEMVREVGYRIHLNHVLKADETYPRDLWKATFQHIPTGQHVEVRFQAHQIDAIAKRSALQALENQLQRQGLTPGPLNPESLK